MLLYYEFTLPNYDINNTRFEELEFCSMKLPSWILHGKPWYLSLYLPTFVH